MKKLLFATAFASTAIASSMGCNSESLTGLHFGLGVSVLFDKYEADVDVATITSAADQQLKVVQATVPSTISAQKTNIPGNGDGVVSFFDNSGGDTAKAFAGKNVFTSNGTDFNNRTEVNISTTAYTKSSTYKKRTTNCGGEVKLAYFHDFGNHLMVGVDLTGVIASKNKKTLKITHDTLNAPDTNTKLLVKNITNNLTLATVTKTGANTGTLEANSNLPGSGDVFSGSQILEISNLPGLQAANPDFHTIITTNNLTNINTSLRTTIDNTQNPAVDVPAELTFEKGVFNPRLAFIVGGTVYGWFAGLRMGMSYTTGKVRAKGGTGLEQNLSSKTVSISSPLIGLHLMKQMKIAGNNDAHLYLTADWNIGDGRRSVDMNGVKNFKQTSYNISAGLTWRFKLGD